MLSSVAGQGTLSLSMGCEDVREMGPGYGEHGRK